MQFFYPKSLVAVAPPNLAALVAKKLLPANLQEDIVALPNVLEKHEGSASQHHLQKSSHLDGHHEDGWVLLVASKIEEFFEPQKSLKDYYSFPMQPNTKQLELMDANRNDYSSSFDIPYKQSSY